MGDDVYGCEHEGCRRRATYHDHNESFCELHSYKCHHCKARLVGHFASSVPNENCFCDKCKTLEVVIKMMEDEDPTEKQNINKAKQKTANITGLGANVVRQRDS